MSFFPDEVAGGLVDLIVKSTKHGNDIYNILGAEHSSNTMPSIIQNNGWAALVFWVLFSMLFMALILLAIKLYEVILKKNGLYVGVKSDNPEYLYRAFISYR